MDELSSCQQAPQDYGEESTHTFILRNIDGSQRVIQDVQIDLSINYSGSKLEKPRIAVFNQDHKPYTPAFISNSQHAHLVKLDSDYKNIFEQKVKRSKGFQIFYPRKLKSESNPFCQSPNTNFCLICHQNYDNYFKHINHPIHIKKMNSSLGKQFIEEIVDYVKQDSQKNAKLQRHTEQKMRRKRHESELSLKSSVRGQENRRQTLNFQQKSQFTIKQYKI